jgi:hypothetical protein
MSPRSQLDGFIDKFSSEIAGRTRVVLSKMRQRLPGAIELVYDNYNALAIGFSPTENTSHTVFSIALYPRWVSLFFYHGVGLPDPEGLLKGNGNQVRHIVLDSPEILDLPAVKELMAHALERAYEPIDPSRPGRVIIKSISANQRPRRPKPG